MQICNLQPIVPYGSNCYLISLDDKYVIIDPSADYSEAVKRFPDIENKIEYVLITHAHFDHFLAIKGWADVCKKVIIGVDDAAALSDSHLNCYLGFLGVDDGYYGEYTSVNDGDTLQVGSYSIQVISCPGHTPGGVSYKICDKIFCGDTVFAAGGYGRCDLPGGDIEKLEKSIIKLITHYGDVEFYPGHGGTTGLRELIYHFM